MYILCKILYITNFAMLSAAPPYLPLYYHDVLGFSSSQIGQVLAISPFLESIACLTWTYMVDKRPKFHGPLMSLTSILGGSSVMCIMVMGRIVAAEHSLTTTEISNRVLVAIASTLALAFAFFTLPNTALVDSAVMKILGPNKILYGEQRLWGSVSTGLTILLVGQMISMTGDLEALFKVFAISTLSFAVCAFTVKLPDPNYTPIPDPNQEPIRPASPAPMRQRQLSLTSGKLHRTPTYMGSIDEESIKGTWLFKPDSIATSIHTVREEADEALDVVGVDLGLALSRIGSVEQSMVGLAQVDSKDEAPTAAVLKTPRVIAFLITTFLFGVVLSMVVNFLFLFMNRTLHVPPSWIGWTGPMGGMAELVCFCFNKQLKQKYGVTKMVAAAHIAIIFRCFAYTILTPDSLFTNLSVLGLQTFHGIGFGLFWATAVGEIDGLFPPEQRAIAQGILGALHAGLGTGLGALIGGNIYEYFGPLVLFRSAAALSAASISIFVIGRLDRFN